MSTSVPSLSLQHTTQVGKRAIRIVVRGNMGEQGRELLNSVGMVGVSDMANTYEAICTTPEQIDAVRKPILAAYAYKVVGSSVELHPKN